MKISVQFDGEACSRRRSFATTLLELNEQRKIDGATAHVYREIDALCVADRLNECEDLLREACEYVADLDTDVAVAFLAITRLRRSFLASVRPALLEKVIESMQSKGDSAEDIAAVIQAYR